MTGYRYANNQDHVDKRMAMLLILCSARVKIDAEFSIRTQLATGNLGIAKEQLAVQHWGLHSSCTCCFLRRSGEQIQCASKHQQVRKTDDM